MSKGGGGGGCVGVEGDCKTGDYNIGAPVPPGSFMCNSPDSIGFCKQCFQPNTLENFKCAREMHKKLAVPSKRVCVYIYIVYMYKGYICCTAISHLCKKIFLTTPMLHEWTDFQELNRKFRSIVWVIHGVC